MLQVNTVRVGNYLPSDEAKKLTEQIKFNGTSISYLIIWLEEKELLHNYFSELKKNGFQVINLMTDLNNKGTPYKLLAIRREKSKNKVDELDPIIFISRLQYFLNTRKF